MAAMDDKPTLTPEERAEKTRKTKAKIRTIRIWFWIIALMILGFIGLSQCAMSKPRAKEAIIESCVKNVPYAKKWQQAMKEKGLEGQSDQVIRQYCTCMWEEPLNKLGIKQLESMSHLSPQEQLKLLGGADAFIARDQQCMAGLITP